MIAIGPMRAVETIRDLVHTQGYALPAHIDGLPAHWLKARSLPAIDGLRVVSLATSAGGHAVPAYVPAGVEVASLDWTAALARGGWRWLDVEGHRVALPAADAPTQEELVEGLRDELLAGAPRVALIDALRSRRGLAYRAAAAALTASGGVEVLRSLARLAAPPMNTTQETP